MSDRNLPELTRAFEQWKAKTEQRLARLELRAWSGAVRSAFLEEFTGTTAIPQTILNLEVTSGRWVVFHRGLFTLVDVNPTTPVAINMRSRTWNASISYTSEAYGFGQSVSRFSIADFGEITLDQDTTLQIEVWGDGFDTAIWNHVSLLAIPV